MNEVIRSFGIAREAGWKPLRTVVFASWDGEEYGLVGSTEWVEQYVPWLKDTAVAYINCDIGISGPVLSVSASPILNQAVHEITELVQSPNQTKIGQTVRDVWDGEIGTLGSGSDYTAFQDFAGIPSVTLEFGKASAVYHYHSNYDSFKWMARYGDVEFKYHVTMAKLLSLLTVQLTETPILSLNTSEYAAALSTYLEAAKERSVGSSLSSSSNIFMPIETAISSLINATINFEKQSTIIANKIKLINDIPWWSLQRKTHLYRLARKINRKYRLFEQQFLYAKGLDGRSWFKHTVFAPGKWTGYSGATFPGLIEALDEGDKEALERWAIIVRQRIEAATQLLSE